MQDSRRLIRPALVVGVVALIAIGAIVLRQPAQGAILPGEGAAAQTPIPDPTSPFPALKHVYVIVLENQDLSTILDGPSAPYLRSLATRYGVATEYLAVARPSQPNYIALFGGSTRGVTDNDNHDLTGPNLADQLEARGLSWRVFAQNVPAGCFTGAEASGGPDGPGTYARKHEPAISFTDISSDPARCANITDFRHFDPAAANFELLIPNKCDDMHDCSVAAGDRAMAALVPRIIERPAFAQDSALFITFDEGDPSSGDQHVATIVVGPSVPPGMRSSVAHTHYSLLRTIEDAWGLGCLADSCGANDLAEFFTAGAGPLAAPTPSHAP